MSSRPARSATVRACAAVAAAAFGAAGCGSGERRDADGGDGTYTVAVERAQFPTRQRIAQRSTFVLTVRNTGDRTIPNLTVTLRGFSRRTDGPRASLWTIDQPPPGTTTAIDDTWAAGPLAPDRRTTMRWRVTPIVAGRHTLDYSVAPGTQGGARARLAGGGAPRGTLTVKVDAAPAPARVDPRTGRVVREE